MYNCGSIYRDNSKSMLTHIVHCTNCNYLNVDLNYLDLAKSNKLYSIARILDD